MKRLTAFIDGSANDPQSLLTAALFCNRLDGRLDVVHPGGAELYAVGDAIAVAGEDQHYETAAKAAFDKVCARLPFARWRPSAAKPTDAIRAFGLLSDLIVLERVAGEEGPDVEALNVALFETPAPVLVCPPEPPEQAAESIAIVWSQTTQAAAAVKAAMPLVVQAREVTVLTDEANDAANPAVLLDYLAAHDVRATAEAFDGSSLTARGRGRAILAATHGRADLLVMGAFGENMWSSLTGLGRTTQKVVTATKIPTLVQS